MNDRKSIRPAKAYFQAPISLEPSSSQSMKRVSDAISPAAAGMGKPIKSSCGLPFLALA
jgi:hypothetical protein